MSKCCSFHASHEPLEISAGRYGMVLLERVKRGGGLSQILDNCMQACKLILHPDLHSLNADMPGV